MVKVAFIIGICGACRREKLMKMKIPDIEDKESVLLIRIPDSKNGTSRVFTVINPTNAVDYLSFIRRYISLRPEGLETHRFFLKYFRNKCFKQPVGINSFAKMPALIAEYLKLPSPTLYTGHSFPRSSATMLADAGGDLLTVKKHGGWKSSTVAEGYVDRTLTKKINISQKLLSNNPSCSKSTITVEELEPPATDISDGEVAINKIPTSVTLINRPKNVQIDSYSENFKTLTNNTSELNSVFNKRDNCTFNIRREI